MNWWVSEYIQAGWKVMLISHIFWVILSITLHELAHGWAAIWQGDDTPIRMGHMNMNPLVHMGGMSLLAFALIGIAWGAMPVDPSRFRWRRRGWTMVAAAGPAMNLLLAIVSLVLLTLWVKFGPQGQPIYEHLQLFFFVGSTLNIVLCLFNLIPAPPLDGSAILAGLSFGWYRLMNQSNAPMIGMFILLALMLSGGFVLFWHVGDWVTYTVGEFLGSLVGNPPLKIQFH